MFQIGGSIVAVAWWVTRAAPIRGTEPTNSWCVAFDNLSRLPFWLSDSLCRLATGGGFAVREHYENDQEILFYVKRPALITGIADVVTNSDLLKVHPRPGATDTARRTFWVKQSSSIPALSAYPGLT